MVREGRGHSRAGPGGWEGGWLGPSWAQEPGKELDFILRERQAVGVTSGEKPQALQCGQRGKRGAWTEGAQDEPGSGRGCGRSRGGRFWSSSSQARGRTHRRVRQELRVCSQESTAE